MSKLWKPSSSILVLGLALLLGGCAADGSGNPLHASGTVETRQVVISSDLGGQVAELRVQEGDRVQAGDVLLRLDDALYAAQQAQAQAGLGAAQSQLAAATAQEKAALAALAVAQANLDAARAQFEQARAAALLEESSRRNPWAASVPGDFEQAGWYFDQDEEITAAQGQLDLASVEVQAAIDALGELLAGPEYAGVAQAEEALAAAQAGYLLADQLRREPVAGEDAAELRRAVRDVFDQAEQALSDAQDELESLMESEAAQVLLEHRVELAVARERYQVALAFYASLLIGENSPLVQAAQAQVDAAGAAVTLSQASAEAAGAGVDLAERGLDQAQAALDLVGIQAEKLTLRAPLSGVVLTLPTAQGEMLLPGTPALTLGKIDELSITVYIPEDRYGEVSIGDQAQVRTDSFPDQAFAARVTRIADQAEYTPRNVQTKEERQTTVYAIELTLTEGLDKLKPGMPADVTFEPD